MDRMHSICLAFEMISNEIPIIFPLHPRTQNVISTYQLESKLKNLVIIEPISYFDMIALEKASRFILTDSGGIQKEAFFFGTPCITMREETEWKETVELGMNILCGTRTEDIVSAARKFIVSTPNCVATPFGKGGCCNKNTEIIMTNLSA